MTAKQKETAMSVLRMGCSIEDASIAASATIEEVVAAWTADYSVAAACKPPEDRH